MTIKTGEIHYCDFCGKSHSEVERMIAGHGVDICSECVELAMLLILEMRHSKKDAKEAGQ